MQRVCKRCNSNKDIDMFPKNKNKLWGYGYTCKECSSLIIKDYYKTKDGVIKAIYDGQIHSSKYRKMNMPEYSFEELKDWVYSQIELFDSIYNNWVHSGYVKHTKPSIDRVDDYKGYRFDNIQIMTFEENRRKNDMSKINGLNNKQSKAVIQMDTNNVFIKEYYSAAQASRELGISSANITNVCNGKRYKTAGGYKWKFV